MNQIGWWMQGQALHQVRNLIRGQIENRVWDQVYDRVRGQINERVSNQVVLLLWRQIDDITAHMFRDGPH